MLFPQTLFTTALRNECHKQYQENTEFRTLIDTLRATNPKNWTKALVNKATMLERYFASWQAEKTPTEQCQQTFQGYRWKIKHKMGSLFLILAKCQHYQKLFLNLNQYYTYCDFPISLMHNTFADYEELQQETHFQKLWTYFENVLNNEKAGNLFLYGAKGTGKTLFVALFCNVLIRTFQKPVAFINARKIIFQIKESWSNKRGLESFFNTLKNAYLLVIDELGLENTNSNIRDEFFMNLLKERENHQRRTVFISRFPPEALRKIYTYDNSKIESIKADSFLHQLQKKCQVLELILKLAAKNGKIF